MTLYAHILPLESLLEAEEAGGGDDEAVGDEADVSPMEEEGDSGDEVSGSEVEDLDESDDVGEEEGRLLIPCCTVHIHTSHYNRNLTLSFFCLVLRSFFNRNVSGG